MRRGIRIAGALVMAALAMPIGAQSFSESTRFLKGVRSRDAAVVQEIASDPSSTAINARDPDTGETALHILVRGRDLTWLNFMLARGARPDVHDEEGFTPLGIAAQIGWRDGAERLLARGANPNEGNRNGETPLILAVQRRDLPMVRLLLQAGANPDQTDNVTGYSALDFARQDRRAAAVLREIEQALAKRRSGSGS